MFSRFPWATAPLIVAAPMRVMSGARLAVAVSVAGGLGFIGPAVQTSKMRENLEEARHLISTSALTAPKLGGGGGSGGCQGVTITTLPIGVGFQLWADDLAIAAELVGEYRPCVAWLFAPHDDEVANFIRWSSEIRRASPETAIWIQIGTVAEVQRLLREVPDDSLLPEAVVVQGAEAGGHGRASDGIGLISLLPEVADVVRDANANGVADNKKKMALIAAGGIADGRGVAAALCLGADGIAMGTRFLAADEASISPAYQQEIVRAADGGVSTTRTLLYNRLRGTVGWPERYSPRTIINRSYVDHQNGVPFEELKALHDEASAKGDIGWGPDGRLATYAGASVGLINNVQSASALVRDIQREANTIFGRLQNLEFGIRSAEA